MLAKIQHHNIVVNITFTSNHSFTQCSEQFTHVIDCTAQVPSEVLNSERDFSGTELK